MGDELLTIGEAAAGFGLAPSTLRWWERQGLLKPAERRAGQRYYGRAELRRIAVICLARETGLMRLDQIAALLTGRTSARHWHDTIREHIHEIDRQIEQLATARRWLNHTLTCQADDPTQCSYLGPYLQEGFATGRLNPSTALPADIWFRHGFRHEHLHRGEPGASAAPRTHCKVCGLPLPQAHTGRPRMYCSHACRQRAYRTRADSREGGNG